MMTAGKSSGLRLEKGFNGKRGRAEVNGLQFNVHALTCGQP